MRNGIISVGNWLVDIIKFIDTYPEQGNLVTIHRQEAAPGGCSHNVLVDLAKLGAGLPLYGGGCIGRDEYGEMILSTLGQNGIDSRYMNVLTDSPTSYTDVFIAEDRSTRTFFHCRGANALLGPEHFERIDVPAKIFHLGYLLLLDRLDSPDPNHGVTAAKVLRSLRAKGYHTSVDVVSEQGDRFCSVVLPCLPHVDYLIVNEVEAGACFGRQIRRSDGGLDRDTLEKAGMFLLEKGVNRLVVIHFPEGGYAVARDGDDYYVPSQTVPPHKVVSTVGAGDAFCAGMLYALHEGMEIRDALVFADTSARFNLASASCCGGAPTLDAINSYIDLNYKQL